MFRGTSDLKAVQQNPSILQHRTSSPFLHNSSQLSYQSASWNMLWLLCIVPSLQDPSSSVPKLCFSLGFGFLHTWRRSPPPPFPSFFKHGRDARPHGEGLMFSCSCFLRPHLFWSWNARPAFPSHPPRRCPEPRLKTGPLSTRAQFS